MRAYDRLHMFWSFPSCCDLLDDSTDAFISNLNFSRKMIHWVFQLYGWVYVLSIGKRWRKEHGLRWKSHRIKYRKADRSIFEPWTTRSYAISLLAQRDGIAAPYEGPVGIQQRQNMKKRARLKVEKPSNKIPKSGPVDYWAAPYEAPVGTQQRQNMKKRARVKVEKL